MKKQTKKAGKGKLKNTVKSQVNWCSDFLNNHKHFVGLSDWTIRVVGNLKNSGEDNLAEVFPDIYEQVLLVTLSRLFFKLKLNEQRNILLHELVHSRLEIFQLISQRITAFEEERMVNDLVRGFERHKRL